jgi:hypothetical protein
MGYRRQAKHLTIKFEGELSGLEVTVKQVSPQAYRTITNMARAAGRQATEDQADAVLDLCAAFGQLLTGWNYEDEQGNPIPATAEALAAEDTPFVFALVYGWMDALSARAEQLAPQAQPDPAIEAGIPMDVPA